MSSMPRPQGLIAVILILAAGPALAQAVEVDPAIPFGHGLAYGEFAYGPLDAPTEHFASGPSSVPLLSVPAISILVSGLLALGALRPGVTGTGRSQKPALLYFAPASRPGTWTSGPPATPRPFAGSWATRPGPS